MMSASFGGEIAKLQYQRLFEEAEHDRLVGCFKQQRRASAKAARRRVTEPCPQDVG